MSLLFIIFQLIIARSHPLLLMVTSSNHLV